MDKVEHPQLLLLKRVSVDFCTLGVNMGLNEFFSAGFSDSCFAISATALCVSANKLPACNNGDT
ncbi:hypothetical protein ACPF34_002780, partial [Vibrio cholerae]